MDNPENGYISLPCLQDINSTCQIRCFEGYELVNGSQYVNCTLDEEYNAVWSEMGECSRKLAK